MPCVLCVYVGSIASIYRRFELESVEVAEVYTLCISAHSLTHSHTIHIGKYCVVEPVGMPAHTASEDSIKWQAAIKGSSYACFQPANADMPHIVTIQ